MFGDCRMRSVAISCRNSARPLLRSAPASDAAMTLHATGSTPPSSALYTW